MPNTLNLYRIVRLLFMLLFLISGRSSYAQLLETSFPTPVLVTPQVPGNWTAAADDSLSNMLYMAKHAFYGAHSQHQVFKVNLTASTNAASYTCGPDASTYPPPKMIFRNNVLYWIEGTDYQLAAFNTLTNTIAWTVLADGPINDFAFSMTGDTIFIGGNFSMLNNNTSLIYEGLAAINRTNGNVLNYALASSNIFNTINRIVINGARMYLGGAFTVGTMNNLALVNLNNHTLITTVLPNPNDTVYDLLLSGLRLYVVGSFTNIGGQGRSRIAAYNITATGGFGSLVALLTFSADANATITQIEGHNGILYCAGRFTFFDGQPRQYLAAFGITPNVVNTWNPSPTTSDLILNRSRSRLYVSSRYGGIWQVYCLPPPQPATISTASTGICAGSQNIAFNIPATTYAGSYTWSYSGTGATISGSGTNVTVSFGLNATSGNLSVTPTSYCGAPGTARTLAITILPLPDAQAGADDTLNCYTDTLFLNGNSVTSNVSYSWSGPNSFSAIQQNTYLLPNASAGNYILQVINNTTLCVNRDTMQVIIDRVLPDVTLPVSPAMITCVAGALLDGSSATPQTAQWWSEVVNPVPQADPFTAINPGNYFFVVMDSSNGCIDSALFVVSDFRVAPNAVLVTPSSSFDTLTCAQPVISLLGSSDTLTTTFYWTDTLGNTFTNPAAIDTIGIYRLHIVRSDNGCIDSSLLVAIGQDLTPPNLSVLPGNHNITCSDTNAVLDAQSLNSNTNVFWTGPTSFFSTDPATVNNTGIYVVTAVWAENGCVSTDTVHVNYVPLLNVNAGNDTLVCKNAPVTLSAAVQGTISGLAYSWSSGGTGQTETVTANDTAAYIVNVTGNNSCAGSDTVIVVIPPDLTDSLDVFQNCDGSNAGTIQAYTGGGIPPYSWSLDGGASTTTPVFSNVPFGTHTVTVTDSLGCSRTDTAVINQFSNLPSPLFLVATNTLFGDTIAFIDISNPRPDSVIWNWPPGTQVVDSSMFSPIVVIPDTGTYSIQMTAYYPGCMLDTSKIIHVGPADTTFASAYNNNGIDSLWLFPNPTSGQFTVNVTLFKKQHVVIQIFDGSSVLQLQQNFGETDFISAPINLSSVLPNGTYLLRAVGEYDARSVVFMLSR